MTRSQLQRRVEQVARQLTPLGLAHWEFDVQIVDTDGLEAPNSDAQVQASTKYDSAQMCFRREFIEVAEVEDIDKTIVHELLHLLFRDFENLLDLATQELGVTARELAEKTYDHELEGVIERVARALSPVISQ
jgi:hypothetical protein